MGPMVMAAMDFNRPLDSAIADIRSHYALPNGYVLFIGGTEHFSPLAHGLYPWDDTFVSDLKNESNDHYQFYGLVVVESSDEQYPVKHSQILDWAYRALAPGGRFLIVDFKNDRYVMSILKDHQ